ncbi:hypothetical protein [Schlesneria paludicola]|uniref:hypothetical protein n=1 Tax=Schlesneria paludicola TaxID=360056 RepID=UPI00029B0754|nr:hypothetical protein [Schlesneria paludicola]
MTLLIQDPEIESLLRSFRMPTLHTSTDTIYAMRSDWRLTYVNQAWRQFSSQNGGDESIDTNWSVGDSIQDAIGDTLRPFYDKNFAKCLATGRPWQHRYECSSKQQFREFLMIAYPLGLKGFLIIHSQVHQQVELAAADERYRNTHGLIVQCVHCRRIQRPENLSTWDWVPDWVERYPVNSSHAFCEACFGFYYAADRIQLNGYPKFFKTSE